MRVLVPVVVVVAGAGARLSMLATPTAVSRVPRSVALWPVWAVPVAESTKSIALPRMLSPRPAAVRQLLRERMVMFWRTVDCLECASVVVLVGYCVLEL